MYKIDLASLYPAFVKSKAFAEAVENIPNESIRKAVMKSGIGDNLDRCATGCIFYDFECGNLIEAEVQDTLKNLDEKAYQENFHAIGVLAENYAEWASSMEEKINRIFDLEDQLETLSAIDRQAKEYQALLLGHAQKMGYALA